MNNIRKKWAVTFLCLAVICLAGVLAACTGKTFTVSLDAAGGALAGESSISVKAGDALVLPVPEREDYIFEGWFDGDGPNAGRVADGTSVRARPWPSPTASTSISSRSFLPPTWMC